MSSESIALTRFLVRNPRLVTVEGADTTNTGTLLSYTVPADKQAVCYFAGVFLDSGIATIALQIEGINVGPLISADKSIHVLLHLALVAGDVLRWEITTGSGGTGDAMFSIEEFAA